MLSAPRDPAQSHRPRRVVGRAAAHGAQAARCRRRQDRLSGRARRRPCRPRRTIGSSTSSPPAGSRCASSTIRPPRAPTSPASARAPANPISLARAGYWHGRAAEALGSAETRRARITRRRRALPRPITASSPAPGSGSRTSCWRRRRDARAGRNARPARVVRALEILYAIDERDLIATRAGRPRRAVDDVGGAGGARRGRRPPPGRARHAAARQGGARARPAARPLRVPDRRHPGYARSARGSSRRWSTPSPARRARSIRPTGLERPRHGPDAGDAGRRALRRQALRRAPSTTSAC